MISVITATFNSAATIRMTIESVLAQTYKDIEYIIMDGGSTDGTMDVVKSYEPLFDGCMHYVSEPDNGIYDAMNKGIRMAKGDLIGILNSDDHYTSDDVLEYIANNIGEYDAIYADIHFERPHEPNKVVRYYSSAMFRTFWLRFGFMPAHPSFYVRREVMDRIGGTLLTTKLLPTLT